LTFADVSTAGPCVKGYNVKPTWTAKDCTGNTSTSSQTINVEDTTAPVFGAMANRIVLLGEPLVFDEPVVADNSGQPPLVSILSTTTNTVDATVEVTRTWRATRSEEHTSELQSR